MSSPEGRQPVPVLAVLGDGDEEEELAEHLARVDDAYWAEYVRRPFAWQRLTNWWLARRWVVPRDIRRR